MYAEIGDKSEKGKLGDCSGSTWLIYKKAGRDYGDYRPSGWFPTSGKFGEVSSPQVGDVVWWRGHVAIYAGDGMMWTAHRPGVRYDRMLVEYWSTAKPKYYRLRTECEKGVWDKIWGWIKDIIK